VCAPALLLVTLPLLIAFLITTALLLATLAALLLLIALIGHELYSLV
jgi:hypothetical protein